MRAALAASVVATASAVTLTSCGNIDDEQSGTTVEQGAVSSPFTGSRTGNGNGSAAAAGASDAPTYHGGALIPNPHVVTVLWGSNVSSAVTGSISGYYSAVLDSSYLDWLDEYGSAIATNGPLGRGTNAGSVTITPGNTSLSQTETSIGNELGAQINAGHLAAPDANTVYMVYFPPNISITAAGCGTSCVVPGFCGCHESTTQNLGGTNVTFPFGILPDFSSGGCLSFCGSGTVFDRISSASSHELVETMTDPFSSGWYNTSVGEIGDPCNRVNSTIRASDGTNYTVQTGFSIQSNNSCIAARPDCQRISNTYGVQAGVTFGFAPTDVQSWWTGNGCNTSPNGVSTNLCQKASDIFGIVAGQTFGLAPSEVQTWWTSHGCNTTPLVSKSLCQRASDDYGIVPFQSFGSAPSFARTFWVNNGCGTYPVGQDSCQKAADLFGIKAFVTFGFATSDVQTWWTGNSCQATATTTVAQQCQNASDYYGIVAGVTFGGAPSSVQTWWINNGCNATPVCQDVSELYGVNAGVTFAFAPSFVQTWWSNHGCATRPLFSVDACQRASDTFGIVAGQTFGFAPSAVQTWWKSNSCQTHPRERLRRAFGNGPNP